MSTHKDSRIIIKAGYSEYMLPAGTSADQLSILTNAIPLKKTYINGDGNHLHIDEQSSSEIGIEIIKLSNIENFIDARNDNHEDYHLIVDQIKERIDPNHRTIIFGRDEIFSGKEKFDYVDIADPETDPEQIINDIINAATQ